jgi:two-component sensor histidine kinase
MNVLRQGQLKRIILLPFFLILILSFGSMWFIYLTNSRKLALGLVDRLAQELAISLTEQASGFLTSARVLLFANQSLINVSSDRIENDPFFLPRLFESQLRRFPSIEIMALGTSNGDYWEAQRVGQGYIRYGVAGKSTGGNLDFFSPIDVTEPLVDQRVNNYDPRTRPWYIATTNHGGFRWSEPYYLASDLTQRVVAATLPLTLADNSIGVLTAVLNLQDIERFILNAFDPSFGTIVLEDIQGTILIQTKPPNEITETGLARMVTTQTHRSSPRILLPNLYDPLWHVVAFINLDLIAPELRQVDTLAIIIMGFLFLAFFFIGFQVVLSITGPLQKLTNGILNLDMSLAQEPEELNQLSKLSMRNDEIGRLAKSFYTMYLEQKASFQKLEVSLQDKEILLREVHHRVKNNLQIVSSMLSIQSMELDDPKAIEGFEACNSRIMAMALVHENAYASGMISQICMDEYLNQICDSLRPTQHPSALLRIDIRADAKHARLPLEQAIPCGLVVNELVTNSLKHGFKGKTSGFIDVKLLRQGQQWSLTVADDGIGFQLNPGNPNNLSLPPGIGTELVQGLVSQLKGTMSRKSIKNLDNRHSGSLVTVEFPVINLE